PPPARRPGRHRRLPPRHLRRHPPQRVGRAPHGGGLRRRDVARLGPGRPLRAGVAARRNGPAGRHRGLLTVRIVVTARSHSSVGATGRSATMTVVEDRIAMADVDSERLDEWFERLERMPVPEGFRVEIVGGNVYMTPDFGDDIDLTGTVADLTLPTDGFPRD